MGTALSYASKRPINTHTRFKGKGKKEIERYFVIEKKKFRKINKKQDDSYNKSGFSP